VVRLSVFFILVITISGCPQNVIIMENTENLSDIIVNEDVISADTNIGPTSNCDSYEEGILCVGAIAVKLTPEKYEIVKPELLDDV